MLPIKTLIIEDEPLAAQRLKNMLLAVNPMIEIIGTIDTVSDAIKWFESNEHPQLVMLDIQLADGISFEIFKHVTIQSFIIFTTAYDQYALKAFELNSIDYLLKPIDKEKLTIAINKFDRLNKQLPLDIQSIVNAMTANQQIYKKRFVVNIADRLKSIDTSTIAYFYSLEKSTFLVTETNESFAIDFSLDRIETLLDPLEFFRINRQYIITFKSISKMTLLSTSRLRVSVIPQTAEPLMVSTSKTHAFRNWLDR